MAISSADCSRSRWAATWAAAAPACRIESTIPVSMGLHYGAAMLKTPKNSIGTAMCVATAACLAQFALTKSRNGFVDGATYTDVHAHLPALRRLRRVVSIR